LIEGSQPFIEIGDCLICLSDLIQQAGSILLKARTMSHEVIPLILGSADEALRRMWDLDTHGGSSTESSKAELSARRS
jgi:hypothetical protein